jgi:hypothetical protein
LLSRTQCKKHFLSTLVRWKEQPRAVEEVVVAVEAAQNWNPAWTPAVVENNIAEASRRDMGLARPLGIARLASSQKY